MSDTTPLAAVDCDRLVVLVRPPMTLRSYGRWILLSGWLLMQPYDSVTPPLPVFQWRQVAAFDTAKECEAARDALQKAAPAAQAEAENERRQEGLPSKPVAPVCDLERMAAEAKCVPPEHVYPPNYESRAVLQAMLQEHESTLKFRQDSNRQQFQRQLKQKPKIYP